jgi:hypothetical protein
LGSVSRTGERLCETCKELYLSRIFHGYFNRPVTWALETVRRNQNCTFCCLLSRTLSLCQEFGPESGGFVCAEVEQFVNSFSHERNTRRLWVPVREPDDKPILLYSRSERTKRERIRRSIPNAFNPSSKPVALWETTNAYFELDISNPGIWTSV